MISTQICSSISNLYNCEILTLLFSAWYLIIAFIGTSAVKQPKRKLFLRIFFIVSLLSAYLFPDWNAGVSEIPFGKFYTEKDQGFWLLMFVFLLPLVLLLISFLRTSSRKVYYYSKTGNLEELKKEIEKGSDPNQTHGIYKDSALYAASQAGHTNIVSFLLSSGADPNSQDSMGISPIHVASVDGYLEIVSMLISAGANVNVKSKNGLTPLHLGVRYPEIIKLLIAANAEVNTQSSKGSTPLYSAVYSKSYGSVVLLVNSGADVNVIMPDGNSPLKLAFQNQDREIIEFLERYNAT